MKKITILAIAITAILVTSCSNNGAKSVSLKTQLDSLNYCIGYNTGNSLKEYYLANDSTGKGIDALIGALDEAFSKKESDHLFDTGKEIGSTFKQWKKSGLFGDSTITFVLDETKAGLKAGFKDDISRFKSADEALQLVNTVMNERQGNMYLPDSLKKEIKPLTKEEANNLNYAIGMYWGGNIKQEAANDTTKNDNQKLASLLKGVDKGLQSDPEYAQLEGIGSNLGTSLKELEKSGLLNDSTYKVNVKLLRQGLINGLHGFDKVLGNKEAEEYINKTISEKQAAEQAKQATENEKTYAENKSAGEAFLAENAKRPEVVTLPSGLQYEIVKAGKGAMPTSESTVKVHYRGTLIDGTEFDSSVGGDPIIFGVTGVIPGWTEALQLMPVGSKWKLYIPQNLAYGSNGAGAQIPPFSALIFDVELLGIE